MLAFGRWLFKYRNRAFPVVMLALFLSCRPRLFGGTLTGDFGLDALGLLLALGGQWLRAMVVGYAYIKRGGLNKEVYAETLVTKGLFAHCRNPLYVGNVLILTGLFVIYNNEVAYVVGGIFFGLGYIAIVETEEAFLRNKFGAEYIEYCARVGRWTISFSGLEETLKSMQFDWRRVLSKELASCVVWWLTAMGLLAYEAWLSDEGLTSLRAMSLAVGAGAAVLVLLATRIAKRRGLLTIPA